MNAKFSIVILCISTLFSCCGGKNKRHIENEKKEIAANAIEVTGTIDSSRISDTIRTEPNNTKERQPGKITGEDGDWSAQNVVLGNTREAEWMLRSGDIDNLGFGWEEGFTPFSGKSTMTHGYPWEPDHEDCPGTDRIMVPSGYNPGSMKCSSDGYTFSTARPANNVAPVTLHLSSLKSAIIDSASLQLFVDDFQSPVLCSKFQVKLNGLRFIELENLLNALQQTGPIGKLINVKIPGEFLSLFKSDSIDIFIDDPVNSVADGFAIDFIKLLINPKELIYKGNIEGMIIDKASRQPIVGGRAEIRNYGSATTDKEGRFHLTNIPAGLTIITGSAPTYASTQAQADVTANETSRGIIIELSPSEKIVFNNRSLREGDDLIMNNIQFELGSANLTDTGKRELDKLSVFMHQNANMKILLSGHTSTDGTITFNKALSLNRVKTCQQYLMAKEIDEGRIEIIGYGSEKPIAPNNTEPNRSKNRRVEMKITKL